MNFSICFNFETFMYFILISLPPFCSWVTIPLLRECYTANLTLINCLRWPAAWIRALKVVFTFLYYKVMCNSSSMSYLKIIYVLSLISLGTPKTIRVDRSAEQVLHCLVHFSFRHLQISLHDIQVYFDVWLIFHREITTGESWVCLEELKKNVLLARKLFTLLKRYYM